MTAVRHPAGVSAHDWSALIFAVGESRDELETHRTDPAANAEPGMAAEVVANLCVRLLLPDTASGTRTADEYAREQPEQGRDGEDPDA